MDVFADIDSIFEKTCILKSASSGDDDWKLPKIEQPSPEDLHLQDEHLKDLKNELHNVKSSLNDYDISDWSKHTSACNPAGLVNHDIKCQFHPELCTQAWCKFHEILCFEDIVPEFAISGGSVAAVHLCEAPGAFICSLNHYLKSHYKNVKYKWLGCTLNPYYEGNDPNSCISDDRLIFRTLDSWCFGPENTGNIFSGLMLDDICEKAAALGTVCIVTADGSINCQNDPGRQELDTACLKYCELLYALKVLCPGGSFVIKIFTPQEYTSIQLLYILCCVFDYVAIRKPATSKPGNSELYVIAKGYRGQEASCCILDDLSQRFPFKDLRQLELFSLCNLPFSFLVKYKDCLEKFVQYQVATIKRNICCYTERDDEELEEVKTAVAEMAIEKLSLRRVPKSQCIVKSGILRGHIATNIKQRPRMTGTFSDRKLLSSELNQLENNHSHGKSELDWKSLQFSSFTANLIYGESLSTVKTSLFCRTTKLMSIHESWQEPITSLCETGNDFTRLCNFITEILVCADEQIYELDIGLSWKPCRETSSELFQRLVYSYTLSTVDTKPLQRDNVLFVSLIKKEYETGSIRELGLNIKFLEVVSYILKNFQSGANLVMTMPSVLTRFAAGLIWIICSAFQHYLFSINYSTEVPGLVILCRNFKDSSGHFKASIEAALQSAAEQGDDYTLLEILPLRILLEDKGFVSALKRCNHDLIDLRRQQRHNFII